MQYINTQRSKNHLPPNHKHPTGNKMKAYNQRSQDVTSSKVHKVLKLIAK